MLTEKVRNYQRDNLGRMNNNHLLAELMPLSSVSMNSWEYNKLSNRPDLKNRQIYSDTWMPKRIKLFQSLYERYNPRVILAYGKGYWHHYSKITGGNFIDILDGFGRTDSKMVLIPHPNTRGVKNEDFERVGHWIRENYYEGD